MIAIVLSACFVAVGAICFSCGFAAGVQRSIAARDEEQDMEPICGRCMAAIETCDCRECANDVEVRRN